MEALRDMEASLPEAGERTEPLAIPSGVFVFGGRGTTSAVTPSKAVDPTGEEVKLSPLTPAFDGTGARQARRMSASKSSSRRRRGSSSSWASTAAMSSKLRSKQTPGAEAAAEGEGSSALFATAMGGVSDRAMVDPNVEVEDAAGHGSTANTTSSRSEFSDETKEDGGDTVVAPSRGRGEGGRSSWSGMDRKVRLSVDLAGRKEVLCDHL